VAEKVGCPPGALASYSVFHNTATNLMDIGDFSVLCLNSMVQCFQRFGASFCPKQTPKTPSRKVGLEIGIATTSRMILGIHSLVTVFVRIVSPRPGMIRPKIQWLGT